MICPVLYNILMGRLKASLIFLFSVLDKLLYKAVKLYIYQRIRSEYFGKTISHGQ